MLGGEKVRRKPFVNHAIMGEKEIERVSDVIKSGILSGFVAQVGDNFLGGKFVKEFESLVREYFDVGYAVSVNSATAGLHIAVGACGVGPGDEVIVTPYSMCASATCIIMQNAIPVFVDIEENSFCIDPKKMEEAITPRTRAIVVVHLFGRPANMDEIIMIARDNNLYVIEDSAQSPGSIHNGKLAGTIGDIGVFSLNQHKTISCGEGGFAVTSDKDLALKMQLIRNHGEVIVGDMKAEDIENIVGFNYRMTELEAAVAIEQFKKLDFMNDHRIELAEYLTERLLMFDDLILPQIDHADKHVYFVYPIRIKVDILGVSRDIIVKALQAEGIPFGGGYVKPIYLEPLYQKKIAYGRDGCPFTCKFFNGEVDYHKGICPVAEEMYEKELMLTPVCKYPHSKADIDSVVEGFEKVFDNLEALKDFAE
jgi:dTDP-4-amino-4,6-dideoxygalactose transaminase